ncbi:MAG: hypothetical protein PHU53_01045 [Thermoplasmata archaeon]|nr:hypothetical protein [Thermoplasmata archaeon]
MEPDSPLKIALGLGLASYCLVLLVSQEAQVITVLLMGGLSLVLAVASMGFLWRNKPAQEQNAKSGPQTEK